MVKSVFLKIPLYRDDERQKVCLDILSKILRLLETPRAPGAPGYLWEEFLAPPAVPMPGADVCHPHGSMTTTGDLSLSDALVPSLREATRLPSSLK